MSSNINIQSGAERVSYVLRSLYEKYGYAQYKMSKFEEYDLYVRNKSFLLSDHIITFTDIDGKLMALKPDVTLSIVKSVGEKPQGTKKVYYNEHVYRVPKGAFSFKEIMQTGLECIGEIDSYSICEVLTLAAKSLEVISPDFVLDVSDLGIISSIVESMGLDRKTKEKLLMAVGEKNVGAIESVCNECGVDGKMLASLVSMKGDAAEMLEILKDSTCFEEAQSFASIISVLKERFGGRVRIDFSVVDDMRYYNGIVFKGFIKGIPSSVLSGGRYDGLMSRMGKSGGAIGFAVYLDLVDELECEIDEYDADVFVRYAADTPLSKITETVERYVDQGKKVMSGREIPNGLKLGESIDI